MISQYRIVCNCKAMADTRRTIVVAPQPIAANMPNAMPSNQQSAMASNVPPTTTPSISTSPVSSNITSTITQPIISTSTSSGTPSSFSSTTGHAMAVNSSGPSPSYGLPVSTGIRSMSSSTSPTIANNVPSLMMMTTTTAAATPPMTTTRFVVGPRLDGRLPPVAAAAPGAAGQPSTVQVVTNPISLVQNAAAIRTNPPTTTAAATAKASTPLSTNPAPAPLLPPTASAAVGLTTQPVCTNNTTTSISTTSNGNSDKPTLSINSSVQNSSSTVTPVTPLTPPVVSQCNRQSRPFSQQQAQQQQQQQQQQQSQAQQPWNANLKLALEEPTQSEAAHWSVQNQATWSGPPVRGLSGYVQGCTRYGSLNRRNNRAVLPNLRLANGNKAPQKTPSGEELASPRRFGLSATSVAAYYHSARDGIGATGRTWSDSLVTALDDDSNFVADYITEMNFKDGAGSRVHFSGEDVSLYGTPKEEAGPGATGAASVGAAGAETKPSFIRNQLQALFQPTDNKLAMKLFGSKKALMKERIRQKAAGHWIIHPCSNFR